MDYLNNNFENKKEKPKPKATMKDIFIMPKQKKKTNNKKKY
jgi:hypothetical protein